MSQTYGTHMRGKRLVSDGSPTQAFFRYVAERQKGMSKEIDGGSCQCSSHVKTCLSPQEKWCLDNLARNKLTS